MRQRSMKLLRPLKKPPIFTIEGFLLLGILSNSMPESCGESRQAQEDRLLPGQ